MKQQIVGFSLVCLWLIQGSASRAQSVVGVAGYQHMVLPVRELTTSLSFYRTVLGLPGVAVPGTLAGSQAWFDVGVGQQLRLVEKRGESSLRPNGLTVAVRVPSLRQAEQQLRQRNATLTRQTNAAGVPVLQLTDPDGYQIELLETKPVSKPGVIPTAAKWLWKQVTTVE
jgi:lactoylglutathione lyase